jgi:threonine synthase
MYIAELFSGPTFCFKDFGMRPVIHLLSYFATKRNQPITLLVSTTGDTGPAAVHAVHEVANPLLTILVHYPHGQISDFQRRQLTTLQSKYVKVVAFEGGGDDMDKPIKDTLLLSNSSNNKNNHLGRKQQHNGADDGGDEGNPVKEEEGEKGRIFCGINSYNIGRPLMQMIHFIWIYLRMAEELGLQLGDVEPPIDLVLPTGAMGNLTGGYMAKQMGIPIGKLCCGVNINGKRSIMSYNCHNEVVISCSLLNLLSNSSYSHIKIKTHRYYSQGNRSWRVSSSNDQKDIVRSHKH